MAIDSANKVFYMNEPNTQTATELCEEIAGLINSASADFEDLCQSSMIKIFARFKPEDYNTPLNLTEAQRKENHYGFGKDAKYFVAGYASAPHAKYEYIHPKGGSTSPNRMRDWDGYYHGAVSPLFLDFPTKLYVDWVNGISVIANSTGKTNYDPAKCVTLGDVMKASDDMYVALYIHKDASNQWLLPSSVKVNELSASTFPTFLIAKEESQIMTSPTGRIYPYILSDLANGNAYTIIAVGVSSLMYQEDKLPLTKTEIGNRNLYSMEIEGDDDRKAYTAELAKTIVGLTGTFALTSTGFMERDGSAGGYNAYRLKNIIGNLTLTTPAEWLWTSLDQVRVEMTVYNSNGEIYSGDLATNYGQSVVAYNSMATLNKASTTFTIDNIFSSIGNFRFNDYAPSTSAMGIGVSIKVYNPNDATQVVTVVNYQSYSIPRA